jgi:hypothetical protein
MDTWWTDLDDAALGCLPGEGPLGRAELARLLGISDTAAGSLLGGALEDENRGRRRVLAADDRVRPTPERSAA